MILLQNTGSQAYSSLHEDLAMH